MFEGLILILIIGIVFGALFFVYKATTKINSKYSNSNIGKVIASFPISYKMSGHIVRIGNKYYFCCENCGIVEIDYPDNLDKDMDNHSFQSIISKQFNIDNIIDKYNKK